MVVLKTKSHLITGKRKVRLDIKYNKTAVVSYKTCDYQRQRRQPKVEKTCIKESQLNDKNLIPYGYFDDRTKVFGLQTCENAIILPFSVL